MILEIKQSESDPEVLETFNINGIEASVGDFSRKVDTTNQADMESYLIHTAGLMGRYDISQAEVWAIEAFLVIKRRYEGLFGVVKPNF